MRPAIYISGPISKGSPEENFRQAAEAQRALIDNGFAPLNPMLSMSLDYANEVAHADWIEADLPWVERADAVLRLRGYSKGAGIECDHANACGVPVYRAIEDLIDDREQLIARRRSQQAAPGKPELSDEEIRAERGKVYGEPLENHRGIAQMWASVLQPHADKIARGEPVPAWTVALCFALLKINRCRRVFHADNYQDGRIYLGFAEEFQANDN